MAFRSAGEPIAEGTTNSAPIVTPLADRFARKCYSTGQKARGDLPGSPSAIGVFTTRYRAGQHRVYGETAVWALQ